MKWFLLVIICCDLLCFIGCNGCLNVSGEYKGVGGTVEYCFDKPASIESGTPAFSSQDDTIFGFDVDQLQDIWDKMRAGQKGVEKKEAAPTSKHPARAILDLIKR